MLGSAKQLTIHPLVSEARFQRKTLAELLSRLGCPRRRADQKVIPVQSVVLPLLRAALPDVQIRSWIDDVDYRMYPLVSVRRVGGFRRVAPRRLAGLAVMTGTGREHTVVSWVEIALTPWPRRNPCPRRGRGVPVKRETLQ